MRRLFLGSVGVSVLCWTAVARAEAPPRVADVTVAMRRAADFFDRQVASQGGYLWRYSVDLERREGEGRASKETVWVQPPGTPSVGQVFLDAHEATRDSRFLDMALRTGMCLVSGQLHSGGWDYRIELAAERRRRYAYRTGTQTGSRNTTTLDDDTTQAALRYLIRLDERLKFKNKAIHDAAVFGLQSLLKAQYPNGAWPQRFSAPPEADQFPVRKAGFPPSWSRTFPGRDYRGFYTFNDNAIADTIDLFLLAARIYEQDEYYRAALRAGDFIVLAQMPEPQPAWAQQYSLDMHPAWARKFEPPAVTGGESQGVLTTLLRLYRETGEKRFLDPIPRAVAYLKKSQLKEGQLARFYELKTNRPLYFTRQYELTYRDDDLPTHYAFKVGSRLDRIEREYRELNSLSPKDLAELRRQVAPVRTSRSLTERCRAAMSSLDATGRWTTPGKLRTFDGPAEEKVIESQVFIRNMETLSRYVRAANE